MVTHKDNDAHGNGAVYFALWSFGSQMSAIDEFVSLWREASNLATHFSTDKLIFDISSNHGGLIAMSVLAQAALTKNLNPRSLCDLFSKRISGYWGTYVRSFASNFTESIEDYLINFEVRYRDARIDEVKHVVSWRLRHLQKLMQASNMLI